MPEGYSGTLTTGGERGRVGRDADHGEREKKKVRGQGSRLGKGARDGERADGGGGRRGDRIEKTEEKVEQHCRIQAVWW